MESELRDATLNSKVAERIAVRFVMRHRRWVAVRRLYRKNRLDELPHLVLPMTVTNGTKQKIALVTGANKGLGLEIVKQLAAQGYTVLLGARENKAQGPAKTLADAGMDVLPVRLDVTSLQDITSAAAMIEDKFGKLDALVNNAGIMNESKGETTAETLREVYETNVIGAFELTRHLLPLLKKSAAGRIVNQSSILGSLENVSSGGAGGWLNPGYCSSKAAMNMLTVVLAQQLKDTKIKVNAAHPGWVKTDMGGQNANLDVNQGAKTAVELATLGADGPSGSFQHLGKTLPW
jgi:NAD(P)-dependent dehydrogenase (short-subunit alcohol dehydrogenase family)